LPLVIVNPFAVLIDMREQRAFAFTGISSDKDKHNLPIKVPVRFGTLQQGDYSIGGLEHVVSIERKSAGDLYGTIGRGRARFVRELERLQELPHAFIVVEADWRELHHAPPPYSELSYKTVYRSVLAWQVRYPRVHWWFCPGRAFAEVTTFRLLEKVWKAQQAAEGQQCP
jgi:ERCC4-type nuclease